MKKKNANTVIIIIGFSCLILSGILLIIRGLTQKETVVSETVSTPEYTIEITEIESEKEAETNEDEWSASLSSREKQFYVYDPEMLSKVRSYSEYNSDCIGWIKIDNTNIDLPIMYTPDDEEYYLRKDLNKEYNSLGLPFIAKECSLTSLKDNCIMYGHNMARGEESMFSELDNYEDLEFYKEHPVIEITTLKGTLRYLVFAYFLSDNAEDEPFKYSDKTSFSSKNDFNEYMEEVQKRNWLDTGWEPDYDRQLLTLSSCSSELSVPGQVHTCRMVVMAQPIKNSENYDTYINNAEMADDPLLPSRME